MYARVKCFTISLHTFEIPDFVRFQSPRKPVLIFRTGPTTNIYPVGQKFRRNRSISHGLGDTSSFKFYHFCQKFENSKWPPLWKEVKFLRIELSILHIYPMGQKSLYLAQFRRYKQFFQFYRFCPKFENSKWLPFLERGNFFFKTAQSILLRYPVGQKFR